MKVIDNENIIFYDVDQTLIMHNPQESSENILLSIYGLSTTVRPHKEHIKLLKYYKGRGFIIHVWSGNGYQHAENVIKALGLETFVDYVSTKPNRIIDDVPANEWAPRVYLEDK